MMIVSLELISVFVLLIALTRKTKRGKQAWFCVLLMIWILLYAMVV